MSVFMEFYKLHTIIGSNGLVKYSVGTSDAQTWFFFPPKPDGLWATYLLNFSKFRYFNDM